MSLNKLKKAVRLLKALLDRRSGKVVFVMYFTEPKNVGDMLNVDLIEHYSNKKVVNPPLCSKFEHLLAIGSLLQSMNKKSSVFGTGIIHQNRIADVNGKGAIFALRGSYTKNCIEEHYLEEIDVPLGDFALLFPRIYNPVIDQKFEFGLVCHYVDEDHYLKSLVDKLGGKIISVKQEPKTFIDELKLCKKILSSSMHGLILSDAYNIPNKRVILSDKLVGGDYKFRDYYSTTDNPVEEFIEVSSQPCEVELANILNSCTVKYYAYDIDLLESALVKYFKDLR